MRNENLGSERWFSRILSSNWGGLAERATNVAVRSMIAARYIQYPFIYSFRYEYDDNAHLTSGGGKMSPENLDKNPSACPFVSPLSPFTETWPLPFTGTGTGEAEPFMVRS